MWLNYLGAAYAGSREPSVRAFVRSRARLSSGSFSPLGSEDKLTLPDSVMANCYASSAQAFDDIHFATTTHPTGPVASALLGALKIAPSGMDATMEALAVGMEVECRLALALFSPGTGCSSGWYTTGVAGGVGAAAAVGRLLGLDKRQMESALGWAAIMACGVRGTHGSDAGTFVPALAARAGFEAALLAGDGLDCGIGALVGQGGLVAQIARTPAARLALDGLGSVWASEATSAKPYPFGFVAFAAVDAARELRAAADASPLDVYVSQRAARLGKNPHPHSANEAIVSIPYLVARTLADPASVGVPLSEPFEASERELEILGRVRLHADDELEDHAARIEADGGAQVVRCDAARGSAARPMTVEEVVEKFYAISNLADADAVVHSVMYA